MNRVASLSANVTPLDGSKGTRDWAGNSDKENVWNQYKESKCFLPGTFGPVWLVLSKRPLAVFPHHRFVKQLQLSRFSKPIQREIADEVQYLSGLTYRNIVKIYETKVTKKHIFIVTEACTGGDLHSRSPYTEEKAKDIVTQILHALAFLHKRGRVHMNLRYDKILFASSKPNSKVKLSLGLQPPGPPRQHPLELSRLRSTAPEVFSGISSSRCDMWSLGAIAFELLGGETPFPHPTLEVLLQRIAKASFKIGGDVWPTRSLPARRFCCELLCRVPESRLTALEALEHVWIKTPRSKDQKKQQPLDTIPLPSKASVLFSTSPPIKHIVDWVVDQKNFLDQQNFLSDISMLNTHWKSSDPRGLGQVTVFGFKSALKHVYGNVRFKEVFEDVKLDAHHICYADFLAAALHQFTLCTEKHLCSILDDMDTETASLPIETARRTLLLELPSRLASKVLSLLEEVLPERAHQDIRFEVLFWAVRSEMEKIASALLSEPSSSVPTCLVGI